MTVIEKAEVDLNDVEIFGHLVANLPDGFGSLAMEAESVLFHDDTSLDTQIDVINDWIHLLGEMKEWLEAKHRGSIQ